VRNVGDKSCKGNQNTYFVIIFPPENRAVYEMMWKKYGKARQATDDNILRRMPVEGRITKATNTHSEYVIVITFARQQWLCDRASVLRFTYTACVVLFYVT